MDLFLVCYLLCIINIVISSSAQRMRHPKAIRKWLVVKWLAPTRPNAKAGDDVEADYAQKAILCRGSSSLGIDGPFRIAVLSSQRCRKSG